MKLFKLNGKISVSCWTEVYAETAEQAVEIAKRREPAEIHIDGSYDISECWHMTNDGTPMNIEIEDN